MSNNTAADDHELNELAGEYVLGTLDADLRADVQQRLPFEPALRAAVDHWEQRLHPLTALAKPQQPSRLLWTRIERSLGLNTAAQPAATAWWNLLAVWRGLSLAGLTASLLMAGLLVTRAVSVDSPTYVVVLVAPQSNAPGWVVQASNPSEIQLIPLGVAEVPADKALEFWTKAEGWQGPVSLGLVKPGERLHIPVDKLPPLQDNQLFELTLEQKSGSPIGKPTGPIQFIGRAVKVI